MIQVGSVAKSIAGRGKERFFAVISLDGGYACIADGKVRPLSRQKRKKLKHLRKTNSVLDLESVNTDKLLRKALEAFNQQ